MLKDYALESNSLNNQKTPSSNVLLVYSPEDLLDYENPNGVAGGRAEQA